MEKIKISEVEKDLPANIEQLNIRMKHIEQIAQTVEIVAEKGFTTAESYFINKTEQERLELELSDKQHKRATFIVSGVILILFIMVMTAMLQKQFELVKVILASALAIAGGAGVTSLFKKK